MCKRYSDTRAPTSDKERVTDARELSMHFIKKLKSDESGVAAIEYAVIGAVVLGALIALGIGTDLGTIFNSLGNDVGAAATLASK